MWHRDILCLFPRIFVFWRNINYDRSFVRKRKTTTANNLHTLFRFKMVYWILNLTVFMRTEGEAMNSFSFKLETNLLTFGIEQRSMLVCLLDESSARKSPDKFKIPASSPLRQRPERISIFKDKKSHKIAKCDRKVH